ncbi:hypothetical protein CC80DRAFT_497989 [Byssothecium circinans]|uniref:Uncharacterized protein n=1 Tax=Byssothecium circinans TaxID=147558 RepID=A0A6A5T949_9PLEO|nr:hypothetical protein CC80DRAFT_497989 [Byssothecium circinans]
MRTVIISARYCDEPALGNFLIDTFGYGKAGVKYTRGKYQCFLPRFLRPDELERLTKTIQLEHYREI